MSRGTYFVHCRLNSNDLADNCDNNLIVLDLPGKIDCGPKLVNANLYRRDYYINASGGGGGGDTSTSDEYVRVSNAVQQANEDETSSVASSSKKSSSTNKV